MELLSADSEIVSDYFSEIENILNTIVNALKNYKPILDGERYLTGEEVCEILHLSKKNTERIPGRREAFFYFITWKDII